MAMSKFKQQMKYNSTESITRLQAHNNQLTRQQHPTLSQIRSYYAQVAQSVAQAEQQATQSLQDMVLVHHEEVSRVVRRIGQEPHIDHSAEVEEILGKKLRWETVYQVEEIEERVAKGIQVEISADNELNKTRANLLVGKSIIDTDELYEKLQKERDYYQRKDEEKLHRIRELQSHLQRRGINIKEMSRAHMEAKCSRWALERLAQEKAVLVEQVGEASREAIKLQAELSQQQAEVSRLNHVLNQTQGGSFVINNTSIAQTEALQAKNEELRIRVMEYLHKSERANDQAMEAQVRAQKAEERAEWLQEKMNALQEQRNSLESLSQSVSKQHQQSLRQLAIVQQQCRQLAYDLRACQDRSSEENEALRVTLAELGQKHKQVSEQLRSIESHRQDQVHKLQNEVRSITEQRDKLIETVEAMSTKHGEQLGDQQVLKKEVSRLLVVNKQYAIDIQQHEMKMSLLREENKHCMSKNQQLERKAETSKRQVTRLKKRGKDMEKELEMMQSQLSSVRQRQSQVAFLEEALLQVQKESSKLREGYERRQNTSERLLATIKERFKSQMNELLAVDVKTKSKKTQARLELVQKYIEELNQASSKTSLIRQLKQENKQIKEGKESKTKRVDRTIIDGLGGIESGIVTMGTEINQEKLKCQQQIYQQEIAILQERLGKQIDEKALLNQELTKIKMELHQQKDSQRQEAALEQVSKTTHKLEEKLTRYEEETKREKNRSRHLQCEIREMQDQLRTKKDLISGLKRQNKERQQILVEKQRELIATREQFDRLKHRMGDLNNKQILLSNTKDKNYELEASNAELRQAKESLEEKLRLLNRQLGKKDEKRREMKSIQSKQAKLKEDARLKELELTISDLRDKVSRGKMEIERKDDLVKSLKVKLQTVSKEASNSEVKKQQQLIKAKREVDSQQRKFQSLRGNLKQEEFKNNSLVWCIKKIYEVMCDVPRESASTASRQNMIRSTVSTKPVNLTTPMTRSHKQRSEVPEGLQILNLKPEDFENIMAETTLMSKAPESMMISPSPVRPRKEESLLEGLQELEELLGVQEVDTGAVLSRFKKVCFH